MRVALVLLCALSAVAAAACESEPRARPSSPASVIGCGQRAEGAPGLPEFSARRDWVAGPVILYGFRDMARVARKRPERVARLYRRGWGALKVLVGVRAGSDVKVAVAPASRDLTALVYGAPADPYDPINRLDDGKRAVVFRPCPPDHPRFDDRGAVGHRTDFAGGFLLARAGCIRLLVTSEGETRRYSLPYAHPC